MAELPREIVFGVVVAGVLWLLAGILKIVKATGLRGLKHWRRSMAISDLQLIEIVGPSPFGYLATMAMFIASTLVLFAVIAALGLWWALETKGALPPRWALMGISAVLLEWAWFAGHHCWILMWAAISPLGIEAHLRAKAGLEDAERVGSSEVAATSA